MAYNYPKIFDYVGKTVRIHAINDEIFQGRVVGYEDRFENVETGKDVIDVDVPGKWLLEISEDEIKSIEVLD